VLAPGSLVSERQLTGRHRLGRAPVRAALLRLAHEGLVRAMPRQGYVVTPVTLKDVYEIFDLRSLLEPFAARRAAGRLGSEVLGRLATIARVGYRADDARSVTAFLRANKEFHVTIARGAGNDRLAASLTVLLDDMERLFRLGLGLRDRAGEMQEEHRALTEALAAGHPERAERVAREQIDAARTMVLDAILESPAFQAAAVSAR
jgi:DNA-binding GntR family transcriptional regulator